MSLSLSTRLAPLSSRLPGVFFIVAGLLLNERILGAWFAPDGSIDSATFRAIILLQQLVIVGLGFYLTAKPAVIFDPAIKRWGVNLSLAVASVLFALLVAELGVRAFLPRNTDEDVVHRVPHPLLGWSLEPGSDYIRERSGARIRVAYNSEGWRDVEHPVEKGAGVYRILVLGDSYMEAYTVDLQQSFARQLEVDARARGLPVEVINMGVGGYGTLQEYLVYENYGRNYAPDLVLLAFYSMNDLNNNSAELSGAGNRPYLVPEDKEPWGIIPPDYERFRKSYDAQMQRRDRQDRSLLYPMALTSLARKALRDNSATDATQIRAISPGVSLCVEPPVYTRAWETTRRILERLSQAVARDGGRLAVLTVPGIMEVDPEYMREALSYLDDPERFCLEEAPASSRLGGILDGLGVPLIDLLPAFRHASRDEGRRLYPVDDRHWNEAGHAIAAEQILSALVARHYLSGKDGE